MRLAITRPGAARFVVGTWLVSRALFFAAGAAGDRLVTKAERAGSPEPPGMLNHWAHWDGAWYAAIATDGYRATGESAAAFFPLYPLLIRGVTVVGVGPAVAGVAISTLACLAALAFTYATADRLWGAAVARAATLGLAFFPTAFFFNAVYAEALFVALVAGALWAIAVRHDLLVAGAFGCLAAATRNVGVLLVLPLLAEWLSDRRRYGVRGVVGIALVPVGLAGYAAYLWRVFGDPFLFAKAPARGWGRNLVDPLTTLGRAYDAAAAGVPYVTHPSKVLETRAPDVAFKLAAAFDFGFLLLLLVLLGAAAFLVQRRFTVFAAALVAPSLLAPSALLPLAGIGRYLLPALPLFWALGLLLERSRAAVLAATIAMTALGAYLTVLFTSWRWVG